MHRTTLTGILLALLIASPALANRRSETLGSHAVISHEGANRLLFKADGLRSMDSVAISRARIEFDITGATADRNLYLRICPVTTSWEAGAVSWEVGWNRPGGDFDERLASDVAVDLSRGTRKAVFDVTPILKEWIEADQEFDGFILTVQRRDGEGIGSDDLARFQALSSASLVVNYRKVPPAPPTARLGG
ncbi:hypothetical protein K8I85_06250 [bacterium]|nr:hypothetical protein [bacterium]